MNMTQNSFIHIFSKKNWEVYCNYFWEIFSYPHLGIQVQQEKQKDLEEVLVQASAKQVVKDIKDNGQEVAVAFVQDLKVVKCL